jgi:hypothetical protein
MIDFIQGLPYWLKAVSIFVFNLWKSYSGPVMGVLFQFSFIEIALLNIIATFVSIFLVYRFRNQFLNILFKSKRKGGYNPKLRKVLILWKKYGFFGTALLSPILLGIPTGVMLSAHFKTKKTVIVFCNDRFFFLLDVCVLYKRNFWA